MYIRINMENAKWSHNGIYYIFSLMYIVKLNILILYTFALFSIIFDIY